MVSLIGELHGARALLHQFKGECQLGGLDLEEIRASGTHGGSTRTNQEDLKQQTRDTNKRSGKRIISGFPRIRSGKPRTRKPANRLEQEAAKSQEKNCAKK